VKVRTRRKREFEIVKERSKRTSFCDRIMEVWVRDDEKERELLVERIRVPSVVELMKEETRQF